MAGVNLTLMNRRGAAKIFLSLCLSLACVPAAAEPDLVIHHGKIITVDPEFSNAQVLPGLIDSHVHPARAAMTEFDHPIPEMESIEDVLACVRRRAAVLGKGKWIEVQQVFITRLKEQRYPTRVIRSVPRHRHRCHARGSLDRPPTVPVATP